MLLGVCLAAAPQGASAALQSGAGAQTSATPTGTGKLGSGQVFFDPASEAFPTYAIQSYQLDVVYDASKLDVFSIQPVDPYTLQSYTLTPGFISNVMGSTARDHAVPGEVNIFSVIFTLKDGLPLDTPLSVTIQASDANDYIHSVDANDPFNTSKDITAFGPGQIQPATAVFTMAQLGGTAAGVPLPRAAAQGLVGLGGLLAWRFLARRRLAA